MKILWVDMNVDAGNPSMQHLVMSSDEFIADGFDIRLVCNKCQPSLESRVEVRMPDWGLKNLDLLLYSFRAMLLFLRKGERLSEGALVHCTGANVLGADLISIHFIPMDWTFKLIRSGDKGWRDWVKVPIHFVAGAAEWVQRTLSPHAHYHAVSRSLADSLIRKGVPPEKVTVIPTPYNAVKFSIPARHQHRTAARTELGFKDGDTVFAFISQGNYHRKGMGHAAETVKLLRDAGHPVHLLVIGGKGGSWERMKAKFTRRYPDSGAWLHITGFVPDLVHTLAAADAFILPSLYEGFAAVAVEAAAMGLPLLLTRHPGTEMILKEGINGWLIDDKPAKAAEKIAGVIGRIRPSDQAEVGDAITLDAWQERYKELYRKLAVETGIQRRS